MRKSLKPNRKQSSAQRKAQWRQDFATRLHKAITEAYGSRGAAGRITANEQGKVDREVYRWTKGENLPTADSLWWLILNGPNGRISLDYLFFQRGPVISTAHLRDSEPPAVWDPWLRQLLYTHANAVALETIDSRPDAWRMVLDAKPNFRVTTARRIAQLAVTSFEKGDEATREATNREIDREIAKLWKRQLDDEQHGE
jgi:hypothetical protein